jgi:hypothetical protein
MQTLALLSDGVGGALQFVGRCRLIQMDTLVETDATTVGGAF